MASEAPSAGAASSGSCALASKGAGKPPAEALDGRITYRALQDAQVQTLDVASKDNPLPEHPPTKLGSFIPESGAVVYLVRRPGCSLCRADGRGLAEAYARVFPQAQAGAQGGAGGSDAAAAAPRADGIPPLLMLFKENISISEGTSEIRDFLPSVPGGVPLLHKDRALYKALGQPALGMWDMLSWSLVQRYRQFKSLFGGNLKGEGAIKGAILVVGSPEQGVISAYLEEFGKDIDFRPIEAAMRKLNGAAKAPEAQAGGEAGPAKL